MLRQEFDHLKKLCRIDCSAEEEAEVLNSLQKVIAYFEEIKAVDTEGVQSCNYVLQAMLKNQMRPDQCTDVLSRDRFLGNTSDQIGGMVRVPPVLKE